MPLPIPCLAAAAVLAVLSGVIPAGASAQGAGHAPHLVTTVDPCVPVDQAQFRKILAIELGTSTEGTADGIQRRGVQVALTCAEGGVQMRLDDAVTQKTMLRLLDVGSVDPASRTRLMALAVAEFVVASWIELTLRSEPAVAPVGPPAPPEVQEAVRAVVEQKQPEPASREIGLDLAVAGSLTGWFEFSDLVPGAGLRLLHRPVRYFSWLAGFDFGFQRTEVFVGRVEMALTSGVAALMANRAFGDWELHGGLGGRVGIVRMEGIPLDPPMAQPLDEILPYAGPLLMLRLIFTPNPMLRLGLELEAGVVTLPAEGLLGDIRVLAIDGVWLGGALSVGLGL